MIKRLNGEFLSTKLENEFMAQQLEGVIQFHRTFETALMFLNICTAIVFGLQKDFTTVGIMLVSASGAYA